MRPEVGGGQNEVVHFEVSAGTSTACKNRRSPRWRHGFLPNNIFPVITKRGVLRRLGIPDLVFVWWAGYPEEELPGLHSPSGWPQPLSNLNPPLYLFHVFLLVVCAWL